jgi:uncharacterized protein (TIGR02231 family)
MCRRLIACLALAGLAALLVLGPALVPANPPAARDAPPAARPKLATSRISAVTVYPNGALVTREVDVPEGDGTVELTVTPLPPTTVNSSLYSEGTDGIRVLATRFRSRPILEDTREDVRKLQDELKELQQSQEKADADIKAAQANLQLLTKLEAFTSVQTIQSAEKGALNGDAAIALSKHIMDSRVDKSKELVGLQQQQQVLQEKADFARRKLKELVSTPARTEELDAVIVVEKNQPAGKVRLNYLVESAAWRPQYKVRAARSVKEPVQLEYLAALVQHTGEDWSRVNLVLSTAQPMLNAAPPDLQVLQVAVVPQASAAQAAAPDALDLQEQVKNLRTKAQRDLNDRKDPNGVGLVNTAAALDQSWELLNPEAAVRRGCSLASAEGPSVTYHLKTALTVPSRTDEQVIEVTRLEMAPEYYYRAVPILTQHVYRLAELTNRSNYVLLPGEATMYADSDFVGRMSLPLVAIGEQFTLGFGIDPQLQVQRQMIDRSRATQGGNQVLKYDYRILVSSYKSEKVRVQVWDRLPHADNDTVGVSLVRASPDISKDALYLREQRANNLLRWDVQVDPNLSGENALAIDYEFKLELDRQMAISSFQTSGVVRADGASLPGALPPLTGAEEAKIRANLASLSPEDRKLAEAQVFCAIDQESPLGSMGPIHKVMIKGQPVFLCCKGCQAEARAHPEQTMSALDKLMTRVKSMTPRK